MLPRILIAGAIGALMGLIYFGIINIPAIKRSVGKVPHWVGILVVIAAGRLFEPMVTAAWDAYQLPAHTEAALLQTAVFRTIKEQEPKLYQEILQRAIEALRKDRKANLTPITAKYCTRLVLSRIPHADDRAILEYMRSTIDITRYLDSRSHDQAFAYLFPDRVQYKLPFLADLPKERLERQLGALNRVLVSSFHQQRPIPTETEVQPIMIGVLTGIRDRCDISIFSRLDQPNLDHAETLRTLLAYYDGLFALQEPQAGAVLRYSLAQ